MKGELKKVEEEIPKGSKRIKRNKEEQVSRYVRRRGVKGEVEKVEEDVEDIREGIKGK